MNEKPNILGIIPARLSSTRLPRKMLADIAGKPLLYYTWQRAKQAKLPDRIVIATDHEEIAQAMRTYGAEVILTSPEHKSGSDRVSEAAQHFPDADIIINIQGDEPVLSVAAIDAAIDALIKDEQAHMATVAAPCTNDGDIDDPSTVMVITDLNGNALYFSRSRIPYPRNEAAYLKHIGLYAFRRDFLLTFPTLPQTPNEKSESLEQLRALEHGYRIKVAVGDFTNVGVDTQADLERVSKLIIDSLQKGA